MHKFEPYLLDRYSWAILFFLFAAIATCYLQWGFGHGDERNGYHEEILSCHVLSYIREDNTVIPLPDGVYPLAMPSWRDYVFRNGERITPLYLVLVPKQDTFVLYPLNLSDQSLLRREGERMAAHYLLLFTGKHAENRLHYDEKVSEGGDEDSAMTDYRKKPFYYLLVQNGYGEVQRGYMTEENAGHALQWYKRPEHLWEELLAIHYMIHGESADKIESLVHRAMKF